MIYVITVRICVSHTVPEIRYHNTWRVLVRVLYVHGDTAQQVECEITVGEKKTEIQKHLVSVLPDFVFVAV